MPIEIKELHVRLHLGHGEKGKPATPSQNQGGWDEIPDKETLVKEAVKEVLRILEEQEER